MSWTRWFYMSASSETPQVFKVDGTYLNDSDIDLNTGNAWTLNGDGSASLDTTSTNRRLRHSSPPPLKENTNYEVVFTIDTLAAGSFRVQVGGASGTIRTTTGTFTQTLNTGAGGTLCEVRNHAATTDGTVSAIEITEVP